MTMLTDTAAASEKTSKPPAVTSDRLMSVDALRGFDMFWIIGANGIVYALNRMNQSAPVKFLGEQLEHVDWEGFRFYDLIFPLFIFLAGLSLVFSLSKAIQHGGRVDALKRVFRRGILLFLLGILYSGGFTNPWPDMRLMGVLNRIALAYLFAGVLFCFFKPRTLAAICAGLLLGYWALMAWVPIRDIQLTKPNLAVLAEQAGDTEGAALFRSSINPSTNRAAWAAAEKVFYATEKRVTGKYGPGYNLSDHIDFQYLPGKKWDHFFDPEGYVSTIPAIVTCLLGVFAGLLLKSDKTTGQQKVIYLVAFGIAGAVAGWLWNLQFPVIKKIWTSSYVLVAGGYSALLLAAFYFVVDVLKVRRWCQPFVWLGMNSITIYVASNIIGGFSRLGSRFAGGSIRLSLDQYLGKGVGDLVVALVGLLLAFWFVHFLYRKKIFLRL